MSTTASGSAQELEPGADWPIPTGLTRAFGVAGQILLRDWREWVFTPAFGRRSNHFPPVFENPTKSY